MFAPTRAQTISWKQRLNRFFNAAIILAVIILAAVTVRHYLRAEEVGRSKQSKSPAAAPSARTLQDEPAKNRIEIKPAESHLSPADKINDRTATSVNCRSTESVNPDQVRLAIKSGQRLVVLDIRDRGEFALKHVPGAINIPLDEIEVRAINELSTSDLVVLYCGCADDSQNKVAQRIMRQQGFACTTFLHDGSKQCDTCSESSRAPSSSNQLK